MAVTVGNANVKILPDTREFAKRLKAELERIENGLKVEIKADFDSGTLAQQVRRAVQAAEKAAQNVTVGTDFDSDGLVGKARRAVSEAELATGKIHVKMDVDKEHLGRLTANMSSLMSGVSGAVGGLARMGAIAGAATAAVAGLAPALAAVSSAAAQVTIAAGGLAAGLAPSALVTAGLAVGTLKAALNGMGDALKASDPSEFATAIADMPPAAQEAATAMYSLKNAFNDVGDAVQNAFWANISNIGDLASLIGPVEDAMTSLAMDMGNAAAGIIDFVSQGPGLQAMQSMLSASSEAGGILSRALGSVVQGIVAVGGAAAPVFAQLLQGIDQVAAGWAQKMTAAFQDGSLTVFFQNAVVQLQQLWGVLQQVGGIISGVFQAMQASGAPFLGTLGQIITATNEWVNSAQGMQTLSNFFSSMAAAVGAVLPIVGQLAGIIGGTLAPAIANFVTAAAPGLSAFVSSLGNALTAIAPAASMFGAALSQVLTALAPMAPAIAAAVAGFVVFQRVLPIIQAVMSAVQLLGPAMSALGGPVGLVVAGIGLLLAAFTQIPGAMAGLQAAFMQVVVALQPLLDRKSVV